MKRVLAWLMLVATVLCGCTQAKDSDGESRDQKTKSNVGRYFVYLEEDSVYCVDTASSKNAAVKLDLVFPVLAIKDAIVCDEATVMALRVSKDTDVEGVVYWNLGNNKAEYMGDQTDLSHIAKNGDFLLYVKFVGEEKKLYQYTPQGGSELIGDGLISASIADDSSSFFMELGDQTQVGTNVTSTLYYKTPTGKVKKIADIAMKTANAAQDHSAICYLKNERVEGTRRQAYIWTPSGGEKKLPFAADMLTVFGPNDIYYTQRNGVEFLWDHYHYDGKESTLLLEEGHAHAHKAGDGICYFRGDGGYSWYIAYKGVVSKTDILFCPQQGLSGCSSADGKCFYGWDTDGMMYQVTLSNQGKLSQVSLMETGGFSARKMGFSEGTLLYENDGGLWVNGTKIAENVGFADSEMSFDGKVVVYLQDGKLHRYADGNVQSFDVENTPQSMYPAYGQKVAYLSGGSVFVMEKDGDKTNTATYGETVQELLCVETWSYNNVSGYLVQATVIGCWFHRNYSEIVWRY